MRYFKDNILKIMFNFDLLNSILVFRIFFLTVVENRYTYLHFFPCITSWGLIIKLSCKFKPQWHGL